MKNSKKTFILFYFVPLYYHKIAKISSLVSIQPWVYNHGTYHERGVCQVEKNNLLEMLSDQNQLTAIVHTNEYAQKFGLVLSKEEAKLLVRERTDNLRRQRRIEFGEGILPKIIYEFCDSQYISQENYVDTIARLHDIFMLYKNEMQDEISDDELLHFMKEQYETVCYGDLEYLESTCLEVFARAIRAGYREHHRTDGRGEYVRFDVVPRWDRELYLQALRDLY